MQIDCGSGVNVLPTGTCSVSVVLDASNDSAGAGLLVQGAAKFELQLTRNGTAVDTAAIAATLVSHKPPRLSALTLSSDTATIDGAFVPFTATIENTGPSLSGVLIQGVVLQGTVDAACRWNGRHLWQRQRRSAERRVHGRIVLGGVQPVGGTVVPGPATFELDLYVSNNGITTLLDKKTIQVTLKNP